MGDGGYLIRWAVAALATWRLTHLLANEDGPADIIVRVRIRLGNSVAGSLMDCFNCLSLWIAAPAALYVSQGPVAWVFHWLALSGAACLMERVTREPEVMQTAEAETGGESQCVAVVSEKH